MDRYVIKGGRPISGRLKADGAKNSALPVIAAAIACKGTVVIENCPDISDVRNMYEIAESLGAEVFYGENVLEIRSGTLFKYGVPRELCQKTRTSVLTLGALLSREGKARVFFPGGCEIGARPIDMHLAAFEKLGATVTTAGEEIIVSAKNLVGADIELPYPSVGATENVMLAATAAKGRTRIFGAAKEPEIAEFADALCAFGAKISGAGGDTIEIEGVKSLCGGRTKLGFDRIEAGTFLVLAAATGGDLEICGVKAENIYSLLIKLCENSCKIELKNDIIYLKSGRLKKSFALTTGPYPNFPTDLQPQMTVLAAASLGNSVIKDEVFPARFSHAEELKKMGADISVKGGTAIVRGKGRLFGATVSAHDLRCGAALVTAGLVAEGKTVVKNVRFIERGYADFAKKLLSLGADVKET